MSLHPPSTLVKSSQSQINFLGIFWNKKYKGFMKFGHEYVACTPGRLLCVPVQWTFAIRNDQTYTLSIQYIGIPHNGQFGRYTRYGLYTKGQKLVSVTAVLSGIRVKICLIRYTVIRDMSHITAKIS